MDDVRRTAEERAKRPKTAPVGASFESERQRSKNAMVKQLDSMDGRNVRKIAAVADAPQEEKILRVAVYCRVSTDDIDQSIAASPPTISIRLFPSTCRSRSTRKKFWPIPTGSTWAPMWTRL